MSKNNSFVKYIKNISLSTNSLLEKYLNKLNSDNLSNIIRSNRIFLIIVASVILFLSYLSIPNIYKQTEVSKEIKDKLLTKLNLNFDFSQNLNYNFFPRPHFSSNQTYILDNEDKISKIDTIKIFISLENLFSLKKIKITNVILKDANFNLNKKNYNFFIKLLSNNFAGINLKIKDSNIFFRNTEEEVLFINKIKEMRYYFDANKLKNILYSKNEVFNIPYSIELINDKDHRKIFSKLNLNLLKLQIENALDLKDSFKKGEANFILNKFKSISNYKIGKNFFEFNFFDKLDSPNFLYEGKINFNPFYSNLEGKTDILNLSHFLKSNSLIVQLLKSEILNNKNLNFQIKINADKVKDYHNFNKLFFNSKIQEGLIDVDKTSFKWKDFANFKLTDSLIFVKDGELILDGQMQISLTDHIEIYKFLLTPKNFRNEIKKIDLNFTYNFDQTIIDINEVRIDDKLSPKVDKILGKVSLKKDKLKNKILLKKLLNEAIKIYAG